MPKPDQSRPFAYVPPVAGLDAVVYEARRLRRARSDEELLAIAADIRHAVILYDEGVEMAAVELGATPRPACDNCGSREDVIYIPDPECSGVHAWYACRDCRRLPADFEIQR